MMAKRAIFRADASHEVGTGHFMRCLALAQAIQHGGGRAAFACRELPDTLRQRLREENMDMLTVLGDVAGAVDARETVVHAAKFDAQWIVVDGYGFRADYYEALRRTGCGVLAIDDMAHADGYPVDLLLNQNLHAAPGLYAPNTPPTTKLLLGPRFSLLRREFRAQSAQPRVFAPAARRLLISFGGSDPQDLSGQVLRALAQQRDGSLEVVVLAGGAHHGVPVLRELARELPFACDVRVNVSDVAAVMAWADAAVTAGGATVWELAAMRLPALIVGVSIDQRIGLRQLGELPLFRITDATELAQVDVHAELSGLLAALRGCDAGSPELNGGIDAHGTDRVCAAMHASFANRAALRPA